MSQTQRNDAAIFDNGSDTGGIFPFRFLADIGEIIVEDDGAFIHGERDNEIRVHDAFVGVEHEIRIDPKIEGAALTRGGDIFF